MEKNFNFKKEEDKIYADWEKSGYFNPDNLDLPKNAKPYTIVLPPPNITDKLHMGHASMLAIEDLLIRFHRMRGYRTLWIPGTDHAAIATQNVVEKKLLKETKKTRHDIGKEKFLDEVWKFLKVTQATILHQTRKMGSSLDWSRESFTLDEARQKAVTKMFVDMYNEGLIYQGKRLVNWCPRCHSTLADDEVEHKKEEGKLYWIKYGPFVLATSRPETKLGDTAVAVHPKDKRYAKMIGKEFMIPGVLGEFKIKVVADRAVDPEFGSGAIKVTPAHSFIDNEIAKRHNLPEKQIIGEDGKMMSNCGKYAGMSVMEAREAIVKDMQKMGLIDHIDEDYEHNLATCYRCGTTVEPLPSEQWFVAVDKKIKRLGGKSLKEKAIEAAERKKINFIPGRFEKRYLDWMKNLHDWCISRQIWFGHPIPVWYKKNKTNLILIRHAQTDWNLNKIMQGQTNVPINATGKKQAEELREIIRKEKVDVIIISPLKRTRQTAKIINIFNLPIIEDDRLKERSYGKFEGMKTEDLLKKHPEISTFEVGESLYWIDVPTAESYDDLRKRVRDFLDDVKQKYPGKNVMIVSHGDTLDMFYAELNNVPNEKAYGKFSHNGTLNKDSLDTQEIFVGEKAPQENGWKQDPNTLDTWFSSGMWTFSTLGWPDNFKNGKKSGDLAKFHPTQVLETGYEIITLWVSRMIMMSLFAVGEIPFENVYLHGLILDKDGKKMSKSKGNGIDPLDMIQKYGADAARLSVLIGSTPGNDVRLSEEKIEGFRNLVTKLWNISRFCENTSSTFSLQEKIIKKDIKNSADAWIISRLEKLILEVTTDIEKYNFSHAGEILRNFTWNEFADWYIESQKIQKNPIVLGYVLDKLLKLWHPFTPFVTEAIFSYFKKDEKSFLMIASWPKSDKNFIDLSKEKEFEKIQLTVSKIRQLRSQYHIDFSKKVETFFKNISPEKGLLENLANIKINQSQKDLKKGIKISSGKETFFADIENLIDTQKEIEKAKKEIENLKKAIKQKEGMLQNKNFIEKAGEDVVRLNQEKLEEYKESLKKEESSLADLSQINKG